jgi:hypothetical protein
MNIYVKCYVNISYLKVLDTQTFPKKKRLFLQCDKKSLSSRNLSISQSLVCPVSMTRNFLSLGLFIVISM